MPEFKGEKENIFFLLAGEKLLAISAYL